jgi:hypothetical protein
MFMSTAKRRLAGIWFSLALVLLYWGRNKVLWPINRIRKIDYRILVQIQLPSSLLQKPARRSRILDPQNVCSIKLCTWSCLVLSCQLPKFPGEAQIIFLWTESRQWSAIGCIAALKSKAKQEFSLCNRIHTHLCILLFRYWKQSDRTEAQVECCLYFFV